MAFFGVLTLVASTIAVGAAVGFSERVIGGHAIAGAENASGGEFSAAPRDPRKAAGGPLPPPEPAR